MLGKCGPYDNFYEVTKKIVTPDTIRYNEPFDIQLILLNETEDKLQLTINQDLRYSVSISISIYCRQQFVGSIDHNHVRKKGKRDKPNDKKILLNPNDSLAYTFTANLGMNHKKDSLIMNVTDQPSYDFFLFKNDKALFQQCDSLALHFSASWLPGKLPPLDALEGTSCNKWVYLER